MASLDSLIFARRAVIDFPCPYLVGSLWFPWSFCALATPSIAAANLAPTFCQQCVPAVADRCVSRMQFMTAAIQSVCKYCMHDRAPGLLVTSRFPSCVSAFCFCPQCEDASKDTSETCMRTASREVYVQRLFYKQCRMRVLRVAVAVR